MNFHQAVLPAPSYTVQNFGTHYTVSLLPGHTYSSYRFTVTLPANFPQGAYRVYMTGANNAVCIFCHPTDSNHSVPVALGPNITLDFQRLGAVPFINGSDCTPLCYLI